MSEFGCARGRSASALAYSGQPTKGLAALETCIRLDPRDPSVMNRLNQIALADYFCRDYEATIRSGQIGRSDYFRLSVTLPLARRRPGRTWSDHRGEGSVRKGHRGFAQLLRISGPRTPALVSARRTRPHARRSEKSRLGGLMR